MAEIVHRCRPLLGTFVEVAAECDLAIEAALAAVEQVHRLMSAHEPNSDISRINRVAHLRPVPVQDWTARVLERALFWSKQSEGAFDAVRAGKTAVERALLPRHSDQPQPVAAHWTWLEIQGASVLLLKPGCIDLGGIAKGFAVDQAVAAMRHAGASRGLVNAGGDLRGFGTEPWPVAIADPRTRRPVIDVHLGNEALATSAGQPDGDGLSFAHLAASEPRWISVTVRAPSAIDADALTKIVWALGDGAAECLAAVGADAFAMRSDGVIEAIDKDAVAA